MRPENKVSELRIVHQQISEADSTRSCGSEDELESPPYNRTHFASSAPSGCFAPFPLLPPNQNNFVSHSDQLMAAVHNSPRLCGSGSESSSFEVTLENENLWKMFYDVGTEMVVTKLGRRMFPTVKLRIRRLDPTAYYFVIMEIVSHDKNRHKYTCDGWKVHSTADFLFGPSAYLHPDSPALGETWMKSPVSFHKVKLTNSCMAHQSGHMVLHSMHKYMVRIHIVQGSDLALVPYMYHHIFPLPLTSFIAVTAYQNEAIVSLKIQNNPFARGFRPMTRKEKRSTSDEEDLNNECSNEASAEPPSKKPTPPPQQQPTVHIPPSPLSNSNFLSTPSSSVQATSGSNLTWPSPFSYLWRTQDQRRCSCNSCTSYKAHFSSENISPSYPFHHGNWQVPPPGVHSNPYLPSLTSPSTSLSSYAFHNRYLPHHDVNHLPAFSGSYQVQNDIFSRMIQDLPLRLNHWPLADNRPTTKESSIVNVEH